MDIALDPLTGDLALDAHGDFDTVTGRDAIAQHMLIRMRFLYGEWHLDEREGVPWFEQILIANPDISGITELFRRTIAETPGVAYVRSLVLDFDRSTRTLTVTTAQVVTTDGESITEADFAVPFVIAE
jgi:hypothetical protein